jgi:hypothetical protein
MITWYLDYLHKFESTFEKAFACLSEALWQLFDEKTRVQKSRDRALLKGENGTDHLLFP